MHTFHPIVFFKCFLICLLSICTLAFAPLAFAAPKAPKAPLKKEVFELYEKIEELRDKFYLYTDGNGHYLVLTKTVGKPHPEPAFWGNEQAFFALKISGGGSTKQPKVRPDDFDVFVKFNFSFWEPRASTGFIDNGNVVKTEKDELYVTCGEKRKTMLTPVPEEEAKSIVAGATFYKKRFAREAHLLVRDDLGTYYYVDKSAKEGEKDFQFFIGKTGQLKKTKLVNIVQDSEGEIFATPNGSLRIVVGKDERYWIRGKKKQPLVNVPLNQNMSLVFGDLGVYVNQKLGTPCDDV